MSSTTSLTKDKLLELSKEQLVELLLQHTNMVLQHAEIKEVRRLARVIARKMSGGTRSPFGSETMVVLSSLFATWNLRHQDPLTSYRQMMVNAQRCPASKAT